MNFAALDLPDSGSIKEQALSGFTNCIKLTFNLLCG